MRPYDTFIHLMLFRLALLYFLPMILFCVVSFRSYIICLPDVGSATLGTSPYEHITWGTNQRGVAIALLAMIVVWAVIM